MTRFPIPPASPAAPATRRPFARLPKRRRRPPPPTAASVPPPPITPNTPSPSLAVSTSDSPAQFATPPALPVKPRIPGTEREAHASQDDRIPAPAPKEAHPCFSSAFLPKVDVIRTPDRTAAPAPQREGETPRGDDAVRDSSDESRAPRATGLHRHSATDGACAPPTAASELRNEELEGAPEHHHGELQTPPPARSQPQGARIDWEVNEMTRRRRILPYEPVRTIRPRPEAGFAGTAMQWQTTPQPPVAQIQMQMSLSQPSLPQSHVQQLSPALPQTQMPSLSSSGLAERQISPAQEAVPQVLMQPPPPSWPQPQVQSLPSQELPETQSPPSQPSLPQVLMRRPPPKSSQTQVESFPPPRILPHIPPHMPLPTPPLYVTPPLPASSHRSHMFAAPSPSPEQLQRPSHRPLLPLRLRPRPQSKNCSFADDVRILSAWRALAAEYSPFVGLSFARRVTAIANANGSGTVLSATHVRHRMHMLRKAYVTTLDRSIQGLIPQRAEGDEFAFYHEVQDIVLESRRARKETKSKQAIRNNRKKRYQRRSLGTRTLFLGGVRIGQVPRQPDDDWLFLPQRPRIYPQSEQEHDAPPQQQQLPQQQTNIMARPILPRGPPPAPIRHSAVVQRRPSWLLPRPLPTRNGWALGALSQCNAPTQAQAFAGPVACARAGRESTTGARAHEKDASAAAERVANGEIHKDLEAEGMVGTVIEAENRVNRGDTVVETEPKGQDSAFMEDPEREFADFVLENEGEDEFQRICDETKVANNEGTEQNLACDQPQMANDEEQDRERHGDEKEVADEEGDTQERVCNEAEFANEGQSVEHPSKDNTKVANNEDPVLEPSCHVPEVADDEEAVKEVYHIDPEIANMGSRSRVPCCDGHDDATDPCANETMKVRAEGPGARHGAAGRAAMAAKFTDDTRPVQTHQDCIRHNDDSLRSKQASGLKEMPTGHVGHAAPPLPEQDTRRKRKRASALDSVPEPSEEDLASPPSSTTAVEITGSRRNKRGRVEGETSNAWTVRVKKGGSQTTATGATEHPAHQADCWPGKESQHDNAAADRSLLTYSPVFAEVGANDPTRTRQRPPAVSQSKELPASPSADKLPRLDSSQVVGPAQDADSMDAASSSQVVRPEQRAELQHGSLPSPVTSEALRARRVESKRRLEAQRIERKTLDEEIQWERTVRLVEELRSMAVTLQRLNMPRQAQKCVGRVMDLLGTQ